MTNDDVPTPSSPARISIRVGDDAFHVEGPEEVVERAMQRWLARIDRMARNNGFGPLLADDLGALGLVNTADAPEAPAPAGPLPLSTWYQERLVHPEGKRGMVQDHVLLFVYHVTQVLGAAAATTNDIRNGFDALEMKQPNVPVVVYGLKNKGMLDPFSPADPVQTGYAKAMLDQIHQQFIDVVRQGRGERLKETPQTFSGLFWNGEEAVKLGLVDKLGNLDYVAREVVGAAEIIDYTPHDNLAERFAKRFGAAIGEGAVRALRSVAPIR